MSTWRKVDLTKGLTDEEINPGPAPILQWIEIDQLVIDDSYQRPLERSNWTTIRKIAREFSWSKFSPVFVSPVEGGGFAIIDGQHRTHAAAACGFEKVPCQIVQMSHAEQAASFAAVNGNVTKVTVFQVLKAALAAGETWALKATEVAEAGGCCLRTSNSSTTAKKPGEIYSIKMFCNIVEKYERDHVVSALKALMKADGFNEFAEFWNAKFLKPMLEALCQRPRALTHKGFSHKLAELDLWAFDAEIAAENRERQREGIVALPTADQFEYRIIDWIDAHFPDRMALPAPERAA